MIFLYVDIEFYFGANFIPFINDFSVSFPKTIITNMTPNTSHFSPPHQQEHPALTNSSTSISSKLPFRCSICHRSFKRPYGLDRHMKLHDPRRSEFEIHCSFPFCKYKSLQRSNVKNHFNSVQYVYFVLFLFSEIS